MSTRSRLTVYFEPPFWVGVYERESDGTDPIGAGEGEWVIVSRGSSARFAIDKDAPLDLVIVGIVDHVNAGKAAIYRKNQGE